MALTDTGNGASFTRHPQRAAAGMARRPPGDATREPA